MDVPIDLSTRPRHKQRLEEFLRFNLDSAPAGQVIEWVERETGVFRILWTHQSSGAFTQDQAALFRYWALARGKSAEASSVNLKQSFRMALTKSPAVERLDNYSCHQYRYFRFRDWPTRREPYLDHELPGSPGPSLHSVVPTEDLEGKELPTQHYTGLPYNYSTEYSPIPQSAFYDVKKELKDNSYSLNQRSGFPLEKDWTVPDTEEDEEETMNNVVYYQQYTSHGPQYPSSSFGVPGRHDISSIQDLSTTHITSMFQDMCSGPSTSGSYSGVPSIELGAGNHSTDDTSHPPYPPGWESYSIQESESHQYRIPKHPYTKQGY